jgi:hypothetical protein
MKITSNFRAGALVCCCAFAFQARAIDLNYANLPGTAIDFSGGAFTFLSNLSGNQFDITSVTGGTGDSLGLQGYVSGNPFSIGAITINGAEQTAPVTGTDTLHIVDTLGVNLTGSVQWQSITTIGAGGILDLSGAVDLTDLTYTGNNSDLAALASMGSAADVLTFQFTPAETLTQLKSTGGMTSYSGSIGPVPEPTTMALAGMGLAGLLIFRNKRVK